MTTLTDDELFDLAGNYDCGTEGENEKWIFTAPNHMLTFARAVIAAHESKQAGEAVKFLANGMRFKAMLMEKGRVRLDGLPHELAGRWVALVAAEDDCHLKIAHPPKVEAKQSGEVEHIMHLIRQYGKCCHDHDSNHIDVIDEIYAALSAHPPKAEKGQAT